MQDDLPPIGWYVSYALENLAQLYCRCAEQNRRTAAGMRKNVQRDELGVRAEEMDRAARIASEAAEGIRRDCFATGRMKLL